MALRASELKAMCITYGPLLLALAVEFAVFEYAGRHYGKPSFLSPEALKLVLYQSAGFGIIAIGMTFVILTGGIDLSVGSLVGLCGVLCAVLTRYGGEAHAPLWIAAGWVAALAAGVLAGAIAGLFINVFGIPPFIATLALMSSLRGLANLLTGGIPVSPLPESYQWLGRHQLPGSMPVSVVLFLVLLCGGLVLLNYTAFGRHVRAIGGNEESARLSGVPIAWTKWRVYMLSGALAAVAGLVASSRLGSGDPKVGMGDELGVIAAVVVGGTSLSGGRGGIAGTFVGLLVVAVLNSGLNWIGVETFGQQVTLGMVILAAVLLDKLKSWEWLRRNG